MGFWIEYTENGKYHEIYEDCEEFEDTFETVSRVRNEHHVPVYVEDELEHDEHMRQIKKRQKTKKRRSQLLKQKRRIKNEVGK